MKLLFKTILILVLLPLFTVAANNSTWKGKHTKEKKIEKQFNVNKDALLKVDNKYGNIDITTWNQNRIEIVVTITTNGDDESEVQKRLDEITVEFSGSKSMVSAETMIQNQKSGWTFWGGKSKNINMKINYLIKMPISNSVSLDNSYGAISLDVLEGNASLTCDYGKLILGELKGDNNTLNFDYTNNSTISYVKNAQIYADYSGFVIDKAEQIALNGDYTKSEIKEVGKLAYDCDYGKLTVGSVQNITGNGSYVSTSIETVSNSLYIQAGYGKVSVDRLEKNIKSVKIRTKYTGLKFGIANGAAFDLNAKLTYSNLKGKELFDFSVEKDKGTSKEYQGYYGQKNSGNTIDIASDYGNITFSKN
ncbi:MAG: hypothetical protein WD554_01865 [Flavobacteriaceae bacterium]